MIIEKALLWARYVTRKNGRFTAPSGTAFLAQRIPIGNAPFWGAKAFFCTNDGALSEKEEFEQRLAEHHPAELLTLEQFLLRAERDGSCWQSVMISGHPHRYRSPVECPDNQRHVWIIG